MSKPLALLFAVVGIVLLASISLFISLGMPWMVLVCSIAALLFKSEDAQKEKSRWLTLFDPQSYNFIEYSLVYC
jgi:hypothetical protein